jgi:hypothetical protein
LEFKKEEASQTRDYCVAKNATHRAARPDPSLRKKRLLGMTNQSPDAAGSQPYRLELHFHADRIGNSPHISQIL